MGVPARLAWAMLAVAAATRPERVLAAAAERFVPADPGFVVAELRDLQPDEELKALMARWRSVGDESATLALAEALLLRARAAREPEFFGRAESVLRTHARRPGASAPLRRLYAETLQYRHDFAGAATILDSLLEAYPRDADTRLRRAALRLTTGDFKGANGDCAQLAMGATVHAVVGLACFAESLAAGGDLARGRTLLANLPDTDRISPGPMAYLLATRAALADRAADHDEAIAGYRAALALSPGDDAIRAALADVLALSGQRSRALEVLTVGKPGLGLLVRAAAWERGAAQTAAIQRARSWLALEAAREDSPHEREAALLGLAVGSPEAALAAARRNFERQRELIDVRLLARAAVLADDAEARATLRRWLDHTGYEDAVTEDILAARARG